MRIACVTGWLGSWAMLDLASWWRMTEIWLAGTACRRTLIGYLALAVWSLSNALISLNCGKTILVPLTALQILHDYLLAKSFSFLRVEDSTSHACPHRQGKSRRAEDSWGPVCYYWIHPRCLSLWINETNGFMNKASSIMTILQQPQANRKMRKKFLQFLEMGASLLWKQEVPFTLP